MTIDEVVTYFKGQGPLAERLGIRQSAISMWKKRGGTVPLPVQWQIELGTKGKLKADEPPLLPAKKKGP